MTEEQRTEQCGELLDSLSDRWLIADEAEREKLLDELELIAYAYYGNEKEVNH